MTAAAAVVAVTIAPGRVLGLRCGPPPPNKPWLWEGAYLIPGGKVEPGEDQQAAAVRELGEETGLWLVPEALVLVGEAPDPAGGVVAALYRATLGPDDPRRLRLGGGPEGRLVSIPETVLVDPARCPFAAWNAAMGLGAGLGQ